MKLKKGDLIKVIKGKDKGKEGKIEKILPKVNKVLINNVNQFKRHLKARSQSQPSEIVTLTKPLPVTNVALVCPKCHLQTRVGFKEEKDKKIRVCKKCKAGI
ncbi:MAG: 50S ribosomal protein L24 [Patescibacteria group bacterium]|nr:50S ribosomal protein L24 [Patescibacteria group bacterium]